MLIWSVFVIVLLIVLSALAIPYLWRKKQAETRADENFALAIYQDQLQELDRDLARGLIGPAEAEAARNEISRRILQAAPADQNENTKTKAKRPTLKGDKPVTAPQKRQPTWWGIAALLLIPLIAIPLYARQGKPSQPDVPREERLANAQTNRDVPAQINLVERRLELVPDDVMGWRAIAPVYKKQQNWPAAATAYGHIVRLSPPSAAAFGDYGEALFYANDGTMVPEAKAAFAEAYKLDPKDPRTRYFMALGLAADGKTAEARQSLQALLDGAPADAPWRPVVADEITRLSASEATVPALSQEQLAAGQNMSQQDQAEMINQMMDRLEEKLQQNPNDLSGWLRLIRARKVSGNMPKAQAALNQARDIFKADPAAIQQLQTLAKELELS